MNRLAKLLRSKGGETIIEVIVSAVIVVASIGLFTTCALVSGRINARVAEQDAAMYQDIANAEGREGTAVDATLSLSAAGTDIADVQVKVYGDNMKAFAYVPEEETP